MNYGYFIGEYPQILPSIVCGIAIIYFMYPYAIVNQYIVTITIFKKPLIFYIN